jgi:hypothetical protein
MVSPREERIRKITRLYYSRPDVQKAILSFSKNRETVPRYFEGFGSRPDALQYESDVFGLAKKGATSFHCSEELWKDPLEISTDMNKKQLDELRTGWDLLIDIDSKYLDYSKISAQVIIKLLNFYGVKNIGIKFSGSKGFHLIVPWKAFPREVNDVKTSDMFPEWARIILEFIKELTKEEIATKIGGLQDKEKYGAVSKYLKGESKEKSFAEDVVPDLILVSSRHLFRTPYSLHEKTSLASAVISYEELVKFQPSDADPMKITVKDFMPDPKEGEASRLLREALDWHGEKNPDEDQNKKTEFKPSRMIKLDKLSDNNFPPSVQKILKGVEDGRKRALFILLNFFRSVGMEKEELEKRIYDWNKVNAIPLKEGYIKAQLTWSFRRSPVLPPNFDKDYYKGIGIVPTQEELNYKNPVNYTVKKTLSKNPASAKRKVSQNQR